MKGKKLLLLIGIFSIILNATELKRDGWNLIAVCQDMNKDEINMTGISQIQSLEGKNIYTGSFADFSNLNTLVAGYGYWVKGDAGVNFNSGKSTKKLEVPLNRDGWNILGMCEDRSIDNIDMSGFQQIQSLEGKNIYTGSFADFSNLNLLKSGYAYWVKGTMGISFLSKDGVSIPSNFKYGAVNNLNEEVNTSLEINGKVYTIKLVSDENINSGGQEIQKDIIVSINGKQAPRVSIINTYDNKRVVATVYNAKGELVAVSDIMTISTEVIFFIPILMELDNQNHPPVLASIPDQTIDEDSTPLIIDLNATDEDGDSITYEANSSNVSIATVSLSGNQLTLTPMPNMNGDVHIRVKANDGIVDSNIEEFVLTINPVNDAPVLQSVPLQTVDQNGSEIVLDLNAIDIDVGDTLTYEANSSDETKVTVSIQGNQLTIHPIKLIGGEVEVTVTVRDSGGLFDTTSFTVRLPDNSGNNELSLPNGFDYRVINNSGVEVESTVEIDGKNYIVKLYADYSETANAQANHTGVVVKVNGISAPTINIQETYKNKNIVAGIYNSDGKLVAVSNTITVNETAPVTVIEVNLDNGGGNQILISNLVSGVINFKDDNNNPISIPNDAFVRIVPSRFQNDDAGWSGLNCKVDSNGSYGDKCYTDANESEIRDAFNDSSETFDMAVFKNHIDPEDYHWNCGEDAYKFVGNNITSDQFTPIDVLPSDYQDKSNESCGNNPIQLPTGYDYRAINNSGTEVETTIDINGITYSVKLYANYAETANDQANHTGIVVKVNGENAPTMQIQETYRTKNIVAGIYSPAGELVAISNIVAVDASAPVTILDGAVIN